MSGELPVGWVEARLGNVATIEMGQSPDGAATNLEHDGLPLIGGAADLRGGGVAPSRYTSSPTKISAPGDIILCIRATIGKLALSDGCYCLGRGVAGLRAGPTIETPYLKYLLESSVERLASMGTGSTFVQVDKASLSGLRLPLPPIIEQQRIVAKLDELRARSKKAREALDDVPALLDKLKQSVLAAAFRGDLTAAWRAAHPDVEPASVLLDRIRAERRRRWEEANPKKRYVEPEPVDTDGLPELPEGWCWATLPETGEMSRGKSRHRPRNDEALYSGGTYPFVQTGEVARSGGLLTRASTFYNEIGLAQSRLFPKGTVCVTIAANIASTAVLGIDACFPDSVVGVVVDDRLISPELLEMYIRTVRADLERFAPATAQKNINLEVLSVVPVPVVPIGERRELVRLLRASMASIDAFGSAIEAANTEVSQLDQSILAKAFRGELVPQDPNDEPAEALLARVRAGAGEPVKKGRGRPAR